ncbi:DUF6371 domain-containing protein [Gluconacetobacter entanii]|uniref:DUF6371 domain-containing protein n=1 Tax=Gluconacetobacter entanii TaxID=108528 RepID=UPI001C9327F2|nr:DUF6371 domain-containing protein [Gluconacetobacter entanii]MBY4639667.1 DUF6371 domain-containing protein [Gluconacetobacter entanii]MCW4579637.1 DUF6371 domain-containing protein [Gluconacetobacter entanii]MCW4583043.1 DUF6371 domain-containing protein [Gluconacetobacter entanii]MCW4586452.1 DUF6371 domain-containing protein [Gluconacetobacter entanii]
MIPFDQINSVALAQFPQLVAAWLPAGKRRGDEWVLGDLQGNPGRSLSINTRTGKWSDFSGAGKGGDPISLYAAINTNGDRVTAARALGKILGVTSDTVDPVPVPRNQAPQTPEWDPIVPPPADARAPDFTGWDEVYAYRDAAGFPLRYVVRKNATEHERKKIMPFTYGTSPKGTRWHLKHAATPRCLYGLDRLAQHRAVLVVEGEKAADAAQSMFPRIACVTWTAGTGNVSQSDWSVLEGRPVLIWPDNDEPGLKAAEEIRSILAGIADTVRMVDVSSLNLGDDAADLDVANPRDWLREHCGPVVCGVSVKRAQESGPVLQPGRRVAGLEPIQVRAGELDLVATAGERALVASGMPVYQRGTSLMRPGRREVAAANGRTTYAACLIDLGASALTDLLCQAVEWQKYCKRSQGWKQIDPPPTAAQTILSRAGTWSFPSIAGVITTPTLRPDGSVLMAPGYDPATRLFHVDDPLLDLRLPAPSREAALEALNTLNTLLEEFPFAADVDRSVAVSSIVTAVVRGMMPVSPLFAFRANAPGSGKSFLVDVASVIATGRVCPVTSAGEDTTEMEKRLAGLLLAGYPIMSLDNVNGELGGDLLCQATERPIVRIRELGSSSSTEIENRAVIFATGNALRVKGDMTRRSLVASLDAGMEQPELRKFRHNPVEEVMENRGKYVAACITIVRSYMESGDDMQLTPLASFEVWSKTVRSALVWLGQDDPCDSMEAAREDDPERIEHREVVGLLADAAGTGQNCGLTIRQIEDLSMQMDTDSGGYTVGLRFPELRDALVRIAGNSSGKINPRSLGRWFMARRDRMVDGMKIVDCGSDRNKVKRWCVERA